MQTDKACNTATFLLSLALVWQTFLQSSFGKLWKVIVVNSAAVKTLSSLTLLGIVPRRLHERQVRLSYLVKLAVPVTF